LEPERELFFKDTESKPHSMKILGVEPADSQGLSKIRYTLNGELCTHVVKVVDTTGRQVPWKWPIKTILSRLLHQAPGTCG